MPSQRAQGLDPEFTAVPHAPPTDIDLVGDEPGQSLAPEDLGNHYLSEAVEQGDLGEHFAPELELIFEAEESAEASVDVDLEVWEPEPLLPSRSLDLHSPSIRENSLLDREGGEPGETYSPRVDSEDTGRHARSTPREALGAQVRGAPAADSGKRRAHRLQSAARASLRSAAGKLRGMAAQLGRARQRKT
ncbi:MAG TPA: hypothetical protein VJV78_28245 [Polyangiales bacterium]|nr:hypothetical protein [Polyangiales bacterium]